MLYFLVWLENKGKFLVQSEYYNQFGIYQPSWQLNLSNPEAYSEPCQISKVEFLTKIVNGYKQLTFFVKHLILDVWLDPVYASVICYSLFGKTEDANKIDLVPV